MPTKTRAATIRRMATPKLPVALSHPDDADTP